MHGNIQMTLLRCMTNNCCQIKPKCQLKKKKKDSEQQHSSGCCSERFQQFLSPGSPGAWGGMWLSKSQCCWQEREVLFWDLWDREERFFFFKSFSSALSCQTLKSADLASACHKMGRGLTSTRKFLQALTPTFALENKFALTVPANICILYTSESRSHTAKYLEIYD